MAEIRLRQSPMCQVRSLQREALAWLSGSYESGSLLSSYPLDLSWDRVYSPAGIHRNGVGQVS